ncbi:alpha/beta hydrolase [Arthrobacter sp. MYb227]|uniref:alpha/beta fold hydrolase n=1 Tax=Arthrobacter sp. MYb227 TaxID=1848601 RepID=UPI000CFCC6DD|nr:alpha/beta hydrolase [Arthrobacter sp. MYb227]PQZ89009.1 alpha/beta hydrolase [Arthrobacter sp. MYb227]
MEESTLKTPDGGHLALYSYGNGQAPGHRRVLVVGGAFLTALIYRPFAAALSTQFGDNWAIDVYDRRGRGNSSEQPPDYSMDTEISDVALMLRHTGAQNLFGHSLGGAVVLNAVREFIEKSASAEEYKSLIPQRLAVYDPAINIDASVNTAWMKHFELDVQAGRTGRAIARMQRGMQFSPTLSRVPQPILALLIAGTSRFGAGKATRALLPTGVGELSAALQESHPAQRFAKLPTNTCFMAGSKSAAYFRATAQALHRAVPGSHYVETPKGMHGSVPAAFKDLLGEINDYFIDDQKV